MTVNKVKLSVGQKWRTRSGHDVVIEAAIPHATNRWLLSNGRNVNDSGQFWCGGAYDGTDLVEFLLCAPEASAAWAQALAGHAPVCPESPVGDLASTAKGSGARFNTGKPPLDLVPLRLLARSYDRLRGSSPGFGSQIEALYRLADFQERGAGSLLFIADLLGHEGWDECAQVFDYGKRKYAAFNWSKGMAWSVPLACAARHLLAMIRGEANDLESGLAHRGHVFANICMILTYEQTFPEGDDRAPAGYLAPVRAAA